MVHGYARDAYRNFFFSGGGGGGGGGISWIRMTYFVRVYVRRCHAYTSK